MSDTVGVRIDKFLWAVRIFKTRGLAADACHMGRILISNMPVKPSRTISPGEVLSIRKPPVTYTYRIKSVTGNRMAAKLVSDFLEDMTPENEKIKGSLSRSASTGFRQKGLGRPTKKERRIIDRWQDDHSLI